MIWLNDFLHSIEQFAVSFSIYTRYYLANIILFMKFYEYYCCRIYETSCDWVYIAEKKHIEAKLREIISILYYNMLVFEWIVTCTN